MTSVLTNRIAEPLFSAAGNILVISSFYFYRNLRTINNYLILNLAIADLIIGVYSMNVYTVYVTQGNIVNVFFGLVFRLSKFGEQREQIVQYNTVTDPRA